MDTDILCKLEARLGPLHARQRLGIETDHEAQVFGQGLTFFHLENWYSAPAIIRFALKLTGLYWRARQNAERILVRRNEVRFAELPAVFDGFTILHISDLHVDMNEVAMDHLTELVGGMQYDLCVLTGDYRGKTFGPFEATLAGLAKVRAELHGPIYGVLGNHDLIQMVPAMEAMGIRILLNECEAIARGDQRIYLAGIDDAHFYRVRQHRKGCVANSRWRVLHITIPYPGSLPTGRPCQFRPDAKRTYARWSDLSARIDSDQARGGVAPTNGGWSLEISKHDRLYLGGCRIERSSGPPQLSARNHVALSSARAVRNFRCSWSITAASASGRTLSR